MDYSGLDIPTSKDEFKTVWCNDPISQGNAGTCWCFSTSSFYEAEIFRLTKLYIVYWEYVEKAREYVNTRGESFFGQGSQTNAVARMMTKYGIVPRDVYDGKKEGQKFDNHEQMFDEMKGYLKSLKRDNAWNEQEALTTIKSILTHYIGAPPTKFEYNGKQITPKEYLTDVTKLHPEDYVDFMSLLEKPFYTKSEYKVPDNWWRGEDFYNVPINDFMNVVINSIKKGYTISIGGDVSESGYDPMNDVAMVPSYDIPSKFIDDHARQFRFSNGSTTDDHAIHLVGYLEKGDDLWFLIKDSGSGSRNGKNKGFYFYHEDFVKLKMMTFTIHKDAVKNILKKVAL